MAFALSAVLLGLCAFLIYSTWAALQNGYCTYGPYISPFYSPEIFGSSPHALFGPKPHWHPRFLPFSPALLILWIPGGFRLTCYYYRGAYYKSFWADPPACAVSEPRKTYLGERSFPLILQNFHRYFLRISCLVWGFLAYDAVESFFFSQWLRHRHRKHRFDSERGAAGRICIWLSRVSSLSRRNLRSNLGTSYKAQALRLRELPECRVQAMGLGESLLGGLSDLSVRLCSMGIWHDWRLLQMPEFERFSYDVLVIGAGGGAGLRAAIEAAAAGVKVGVVCKSLLGKAHTVMAQGGVAAALANVDDRDD